MTYKTDYHIHSTYSDGRSAPEDYIGPAIEAGLSELGFSEHLNLSKGPQNWIMDPETIPAYLDHIQELKKKNESIKIRIGFEVDFFPGMEKEIRDFIDPFPLDYVIGSVHYLGEDPVDLGSDFYEGKNIDRLYESYFDNVSAAASSGLFDIIGHCDLIRIYGYKPSSSPEKLYRNLARIMRKNDIAFELNTNGRNRPIADFYPERKFLHIFMEEKVPVCVNSDAHMPSRVAQYFDEAYQLLRYTGFTEMAVFDGRKRKLIPF